jgi:hypothetical protein
MLLITCVSRASGAFFWVWKFSSRGMTGILLAPAEDTGAGSGPPLLQQFSMIKVVMYQYRYRESTKSTRSRLRVLLDANTFLLESKAIWKSSTRTVIAFHLLENPWKPS